MYISTRCEPQHHLLLCLLPSLLPTSSAFGVRGEPTLPLPWLVLNSTPQPTTHQKTKQKGLVLALDSGSHPQERGMALERCPTRQRAAVFFYARPTLPGSDGPVLAPPLSPSSPSPWVPIIIPAETFAQPGYSYPVTPAANMARCEAAKHAATFVGDPADQRWGRALSALARAPGFVRQLRQSFWGGHFSRMSHAFLSDYATSHAPNDILN